MAKEWRLLDLAGKGVMPYETEASEHLRVSYGPSCHVGCGTVLLPEQVLTPPTVQFELSKEEQRHISLVMIDVDSELCLWAVYCAFVSCVGAACRIPSMHRPSATTGHRIQDAALATIAFFFVCSPTAIPWWSWSGHATAIC